MKRPLFSTEVLNPPIMREIYHDDALHVSKGEPHFKMIANENPNEIRRFWI